MFARVDKRPFSFWLLADNTLPDSMDLSEAGFQRMKARLIHALLFNVFEQAVLISDSQLIDNNCLRMLIRQDDRTLRLFQDQLVTVAVRADDSGTMMDLEDVVAGHKVKRKYLFRHDEFGEGTEIADLKTVCKLTPYSLIKVSKRFQELALWMFGGPQGKRHLPERLASDIHQAARKHLKDHGELGWIFFYERLRDILSEEDYSAHHETINRLVEMPYHTGLPAILGADPIYAERHAKSFELARGVRQQHALDEHKTSFEGRLGIAAFERGVTLLEADDVIRLLDSAEAHEFADARDRFDGSDNGRRELLESLQFYVYRIEETILENHESLKRESADGATREASLSIDEWKQAGLDAFDFSADVVDLGLNIADAATQAAKFASLSLAVYGVGRSIVDLLIVDKIQEKEIQRRVEEERRRAAEQSRRKEEFLREMASSPVVEHDMIREAPKEDVEVDVGKVDLDSIETCYR